MSSIALVSPAEWRQLLRSLLRECTYLPDPIAKGYMHDYVTQRFRRYSEERAIDNDINRHHQLRKAAKQRLSLLRRANEGYTKSLEQVLRLSYGRTGKRRRDLLARFITPDVPANTQEVAKLVNRPSMLDDGWEPPQIVMDLLKAQQKHGVIHEFVVRPQVKTTEPPIPKENAWGKPVHVSRRRNIRKDWYSAVLNSLFPPLPGDDVKVLQGLISGSVPWTPPKKRKAIGASPGEPRARLSTEFLVDGPAKGRTFREYVDGRPHNITRRFMRRLWQRIICIVPQLSWNDTSKKYSVDWEPAKRPPAIAMALSDEQTLGIFGNVNTRRGAIAPTGEPKEKPNTEPPRAD